MLTSAEYRRQCYRPGQAPLSRHFQLGIAACVAIWVGSHLLNSPGFAQNQGLPVHSSAQKFEGEGQKTKTAPSDGPQYSAEVSTNWEFGMKITAVGNAAGIVGSVPIPLDWPEQTIISEIEVKPDGIGKIRYSQPTRESRLMTFQIPKMAAGETISVFIRFEIAKRNILVPQDTAKLHLPARLPNDVNAFLKPSPYIESKHKRIVEIANRLHNESLSDWEQIETIYRWVRENIEYRFDPQIRTCLDALDAGQGDCEEMSSLFIAICRAMHIPARAVLIPDHTYPEFYLADENGNGYWFPCQVAGEYQFGSMSELRPVLHKGDRFKVAGQNGMARYLQPTLIEKSGLGQITIEWITQNRDTPPPQ
jgi:hypothetical protein